MTELLKPSEAAKELGYTPQWVTYLLREEKIKGRRLGNQWVIAREDLEAYMAEREKSAKK